MKRLLDRHGYPADLALAAFLLAVALPGWLRIGRPQRLLELAVICLVGWRRKAPLAAAILAALVSVIDAVASGPGNAESDSVGSVAAVLVLNYSVAAYGVSLRRAFAGGTILLAGVSADLILYGLGNDDFWVFRILFMASTWAAGWAMHDRQLQVHRLETRTERLEREQSMRAEQAVASERSRLARELHDLIAHNVSMIGVQAAAAEHVLSDRPDQARESLRNIQAAARQTIDELRRLLGVLRTHDAEPAVAPQPSLKDVDPLIEKLRETGLDIELAVDGAPRQLPASLELSGFRILQEALTNGLKHAPGAHFRVRLRYGSDALEIGVENDNGGPGASREGGFGLIGMRERVQLFGGSLQAGPRPEGGFALKASLPLEGGSP